jgi:hypothetical protein
MILEPGNRVAIGPGEKVEWTAQDFACESRLVARHLSGLRRGPNLDIEESFFPRWRTAAGRVHLELGTLLRGLGRRPSKRGAASCGPYR